MNSVFTFFCPLNSFKIFLSGKLDEKSETHKELKEKGFIGNISSQQRKRLISSYWSKNFSLFQSRPSLHIVVATLRCNLRCVYCQTSSVPLTEKGHDMSLNTAKQTVDFIFEASGQSLSLEFQGGEPLVNWPAVKFIIEYARKKSEMEGKNLEIRLVTNLILMDQEKLDFLLKNRINICTSLDGPEKVHNKNRPYAQGNSYKATVNWIKKIRERIKKTRSSSRIFLGSLVTISKYSLKYPKEIVDEYAKWGFKSVHLRPLTYLGLASGFENEIGYSAEEFIGFWKKGIDYIVSINKNGKFFHEREARIMLQKILSNIDPNYSDLRSPCGAAVSQLAYDYNGNIYTCDEGRMLGDDTFLTGNVGKDSYQDIISNNKVKAMLVSSCLDNLSCDYCVYKTYCGVCPVRNYAYYGNLFPQMNNTDWCRIKTAQFDYLFEKIRDEKTKKIFEKWARETQYG